MDIKDIDLEDVRQQFIDWNKKKINHHINKYEVDHKDLYFYEREIWWTALGKNIGYELDGKHELFERPVLILRKYTKSMCFVLPLTTKIKEFKPWYHCLIDVDGCQNAVILNQGRTISSNRLLRKKIKIDEGLFNMILSEFMASFKGDL